MGLSFLCSKLIAQSEQLEDKVLSALSTLDQTQCPSGILYERVPEYYPLEYWRGNYLSDSTSFLISRFCMLHGMLQIMDINQNLTLPKMNDIVLDAQKLKSSDTVRLGILLQQYDRISSDAITNNLIYFENGNFYDVPKRIESPYRT
ncbi:MAG: hypothetical protein IPH93_05335 [Saprospiraceae bacterium]|nr:hypothetical protein [Saprospiraceae bacterium]